MLNHTGETYSHNMMDYLRIPISEMHLGKFPDSLEFRCWRVNFKTEVCANSVFPLISMHWIKKLRLRSHFTNL